MEIIQKMPGDTMKSYNRSNINEEPIISPVVDADQSWKLRYLEQLKESRETGKPLSEVINADRHPADHIRVQTQIKKIIDAEMEQRNRFKLRDQK